MLEPPVRMHDRPGHLIRRANQVHGYLWSTRVSRTVTSSQFSVLAVIDERGECDQIAVAREASLDSSTVGAVIFRLIERGWIDSRRDGRDRRRNLLSLTAEGRELFDSLAPAAASMSDLLLDGLDETERAALIALLGRVVDDGERLRSTD